LKIKIGSCLERFKQWWGCNRWKISWYYIFGIIRTGLLIWEGVGIDKRICPVCDGKGWLWGHHTWYPPHHICHLCDGKRIISQEKYIDYFKKYFGSK